jgi:rhamnulokinase
LIPPLRRVDVLAGTGLADPVPVSAVGSHHTASAVVRVPAASDRFAPSPVERRP